LAGFDRLRVDLLRADFARVDLGLAGFAISSY
jgi:hypothetical protein